MANMNNPEMSGESFENREGQEGQKKGKLQELNEKVRNDLKAVLLVGGLTVGATGLTSNTAKAEEQLTLDDAMEDVNSDLNEQEEKLSQQEEKLSQQEETLKKLRKETDQQEEMIKKEEFIFNLDDRYDNGENISDEEINKAKNYMQDILKGLKNNKYGYENNNYQLTKSTYEKIAKKLGIQDEINF